ncbi:A/G-specific adenine glycosylase [Candidatus Saccharibacteria bacterium oral taxon 488]|nr:A/G-specific adenine glycosylase [Candidatus Saccharibacteria bacterium oral taxon 488]
MTTDEFQGLIHQKGRELYRPMPWRDRPTLYYVLVSELMLQQTQVARVLAKFTEFTTEFPDIESLAAAELTEVLRAWQGLGYNRRARYIHQTARAITGGALAATLHDLVQLPGIGVNTAGAIMNYTYQVPTPFIETNIRTVYLNHFFADQTAVADRDILPIVERTMDQANPRQWFWALMDYGSELKSQGKGKLSASRHYTKQSQFTGSLRQMRGEILRRYVDGRSLAEITAELQDDPRFAAALDGLRRDGLIAAK